ncbi:hypothetical protein M3J09_010476 [Ascochyta lentis]
MSKGFINLPHTKIGIYHGSSQRRGDKSQSVGEVIHGINKSTKGSSKLPTPNFETDVGKQRCRWRLGLLSCVLLELACP